MRKSTWGQEHMGIKSFRLPPDPAEGDSYRSREGRQPVRTSLEFSAGQGRPFPVKYGGVLQTTGLSIHELCASWIQGLPFLCAVPKTLRTT